MKINKVLVVDFKNKKVTQGYEGPSSQVFVPLVDTEELTQSRKRVTEAIERIDSILADIARLNKKEE